MKMVKRLIALSLLSAGSAHAVLHPTSDALDSTMAQCEKMISQQESDIDSFKPSSNYYPQFTIEERIMAGSPYHPFTLKYDKITDFYCKGTIDPKGRVVLEEQLYLDGKPI
jgi:hypothetical protein